MANLNDWDSLMEGAFGRRRRTTDAPKPTLTHAPVTATTPTTPTATPHTTNTPTAPTPTENPFADLTAALMEQQKALDAQLKAQQAELTNMATMATAANIPTVGQLDTDTTAPTQTGAQAKPHPYTANATDLVANLEQDGLLAKGTSTTPTAHQGNFVGLAEELQKIVLGQDAFVQSLVRAMRRPFVLGNKGNTDTACNVVLISGNEGTGRHFALPHLVEKMAARGLLQNASIATLNLALYPDSTNEKIFLQDLYAALQGSGEVVVFEGYAQCHPSFLKTIATLATTGSAPLSSRYILNKDGILIDAGSALAPNAIRSFTPNGKYFIFYARKGKLEIADHFGAGMLTAVGDTCTTSLFAPETLTTIAAVQLNALSAKVREHLGFSLSADATVRDFVAMQATDTTGAKGILQCTAQIYRALSEYCLAQDDLPTGQMTLTVTAQTLHFAFAGASPAPLFALLPQTYQGSRTETEAALDALVGLDSVKDYVRALADNLEIQQRRAEAGFKNASLSMHMIFSGNPGTGKTTIARLIAQYLKAIGALRGGQLIEVSRADLVGRYSGHTAPLTHNVIESALGGVLFIDEAYSLFRGEQDSFGLEAIDTLVKGMEDHRNDLVVVLAGYTDEMNLFLTANSGLASRFSNHIEFPDYTANELLAITKLQAKGKGYRLDADCDIPLLGYYGAEQALHADTAGNGRLARNTLEKAILNQSKRLIATPDAPLDLLCADDFA